MQLSLFPEDPPEDGGLDLAYFCLRPPEAVSERIAAIYRHARAAHGMRRRPRPPSTYHLSLIGLGRLRRLRPAELDAALGAGGHVQLPAFELCFTRLQSWRRNDGRATFVLLGTADSDRAATGLAKAIGNALVMNGVRCGEPPGRPHLTLAYDPVEVPETPLSEPVSFAADAFALVRNRHGQSVLEELRRYRLG